MTNTLTPGHPTPTDSPPARRLARPRWTDRRLWVGIALVLVSLFGVTRVVASADQTVEVWSAATDLASGVAITSDDVRQSSVRLDSLTPYFVGDTSPVGYVTASDFVAGELITHHGVEAEESATALRFVTLPVERNHFPADLQRGEQVDVYLVARAVSGEPVGDPRLVLDEVTVAEVNDGDSRFGGSSLELGISLMVAADNVPALVAAEARGTLTLVRVPMDSP